LTVRAKVIAKLKHRWRSVGVLPAIVFALGLCLSMAGSKWLEFNLDSEAKAELKRRTNRVAEEVSRRFRESIYGTQECVVLAQLCADWATSERQPLASR